MNVGILILAIMNMLVGILFVALCRPLVQGKIGRNGLYGFRTPKTLASDKAWYAANHGVAKAGVSMSIGMVIFGIVLALLSLVMTLLPSTIRDYLEPTLLIAAVASPLLLVVGLWVAMSIELKKLDKDSLADPEQML